MSYIYHQEILFEIIVLISKLVPYYSFYIKKVSVDKLQLKQTELDRKYNSTFPETEDAIKLIRSSLNANFKYTLLEVEDHKLEVPEISTTKKDLGQACVYDAIFTDNPL